jgi:restriction system protein
MAIPTYEQIMHPLLIILQDQQNHSKRDLVERISEFFQLTDEERDAKLPSGQQTYIDNRTGWARTHLKKAGCLEYVSRGIYKITERGLKLLKDNYHKVDNNTLRQFSEFLEWFDAKPEKETITISPVKAEQNKTPDESLADAYQTIRKNLALEIVDTVKSCSPDFFEKLVIDLLVKMGYGGTLEEAGQVIGRSGDGGIDGIINEDRLGLDVIYIQAKRWESVVGRPEIQKFAGALQGRRAKKGVFITTSGYTNEAKDFVSLIESKIVLIDGKELAELMIDFNVGVSVKDTFVIKRIDSDYFIEE